MRSSGLNLNRLYPSGKYGSLSGVSPEIPGARGLTADGGFTEILW